MVSYAYWQLGRIMTLSPIEIARAYNAPLLRGQGVSANANLDLLLEKMEGNLAPESDTVKSSTTLLELRKVVSDLG